MTQSELKRVASIGAELGAAKAEVERLRGLLREACELIQEQDARIEVDMLPAGIVLMSRINAAISQQAEQQPVTQGLPELLESVRLSDEEAKPHGPGATYWNNAVVACQVAIRDALYTAPIAQTAPQGKFRTGDLVKKSTGSEWVGHVCGWYSTTMTPEGYAVESEAHAGSVQIYPAKALEAVE